MPDERPQFSKRRYRAEKPKNQAFAAATSALRELADLGRRTARPVERRAHADAGGASGLERRRCCLHRCRPRHTSAYAARKHRAPSLHDSAGSSISAGNSLSPCAPAASAAKPSLGVASSRRAFIREQPCALHGAAPLQHRSSAPARAVGRRHRPRARRRRPTSTVPAPIGAFCAPTVRARRPMLSNGCGEFSGTSITAITAGDQRIGDGQLPRRASRRAGWRRSGIGRGRRAGRASASLNTARRRAQCASARPPRNPAARACCRGRAAAARRCSVARARGSR